MEQDRYTKISYAAQKEHSLRLLKIALKPFVIFLIIGAVVLIVIGIILGITEGDYSYAKWTLIASAAYTLFLVALCEITFKIHGKLAVKPHKLKYAEGYLIDRPEVVRKIYSRLDNNRPNSDTKFVAFIHKDFFDTVIGKNKDNWKPNITDHCPADEIYFFSVSDPELTRKINRIHFSTSDRYGNKICTSSPVKATYITLNKINLTILLDLN